MNKTVELNSKAWTNIRSQFLEKRAYYHTGDGSLAEMPHTICLAVNNYCFMRCAMCDVGQSIKDKGLRDDQLFFFHRQTGAEKAYSLPFEAIKKLVDDVAPYGPIIRANFLEPLTRDDIADIAEYTTSRGLEFFIITNGYLLPKRAISLLDAGVRAIRVSLDGPKEIHNRIRGLPDSFDNAMEGLKLVISEKKRRGQDYPLVGVCLTIQDNNHDRILDFYRELEAESIAKDVYVAFNHLKYNTAEEALRHNSKYSDHFPLTQSSLTGTDLAKIDIDVLWDQFVQIRKEFPRSDYKNHFNPLLTTKQEFQGWYDPNRYFNPGAPCYVPWTIAQVYFDGNVGVNGRCVSPSFGNILKQSFPEIWNSDSAQAFRRAVVKDPTMPACNRCNRFFHLQD